MIKPKLDRKQLSSWALLALGACLLTVFTACRTEERFLVLGDRFPGPVDVVYADPYFYVLNSDYDRRFNKGSIVVLDADAADGEEKLAVVEVPRMGRSMFSRSSWLLLTFDRLEFDGNGRVELRRISDDGLALPLQASWDIPCSPINGVISPLERYLVVSCLGGDIYAGRLDVAEPGQSSLQLVRRYGFSRRALHIFESSTQSVLLAFPTDMADPRLADLSAADTKTYNPDNPIGPGGALELDEGPNEVPDVFETELADIRRPDRRFPYQMAIYDLRQAEDEGFPLILNGTIASPSQADLERKFVYFTLKNVDGMWESEEQWINPDRKYYRTNFWSTQEHPDDPNVFYLSHRGFRDSPFANNILQVTITPESLADTSNLPLTSEILWFERIYGFQGENLDGRNYPGDFALTTINQEDVLLVNHFRDAVYWDPIQQKFSVAFKRLGTLPTEFPVEELPGIGFDQSFYQIAVGQSGTVVSCSFYGDSVLILDVDPQTGISLRKQLY